MLLWMPGLRMMTTLPAREPKWWRSTVRMLKGDRLKLL